MATLKMFFFGQGWRTTACATGVGEFCPVTQKRSDFDTFGCRHPSMDWWIKWWAKTERGQTRKREGGRNKTPQRKLFCERRKSQQGAFVIKKASFWFDSQFYSSISSFKSFISKYSIHAGKVLEECDTSVSRFESQLSRIDSSLLRTSRTRIE